MMNVTLQDYPIRLIFLHFIACFIYKRVHIHTIYECTMNNIIFYHSNNICACPKYVVYIQLVISYNNNNMCKDNFAILFSSFHIYVRIMLMNVH